MSRLRDGMEASRRLGFGEAERGKGTGKSGKREKANASEQ